MQQQLALTHRRVRMRKAVECTEAQDAREPKWSDLAYAHLVRFAAGREGEFLGEEAIYSITNAGLPRPEDKRAFGSVFTRAVRSGAIVRVGMSKATRNCSWKPTYRRGAA